MEGGTKPEKGNLVKSFENTVGEGKAIASVCALLDTRKVALEPDFSDNPCHKCCFCWRSQNTCHCPNPQNPEFVTSGSLFLGGASLESTVQIYLNISVQSYGLELFSSLWLKEEECYGMDKLGVFSGKEHRGSVLPLQQLASFGT